MANLVTFAKKLWKDKVGGNTPITAAELNRMEDGISNCANQINKLGDSVSRIKFAESDTKLIISYTEDDGFQIGIQGTPFYVWFNKNKGVGIWDSSEHRNYTCSFDTIR